MYTNKQEATAVYILSELCGLRISSHKTLKEESVYHVHCSVINLPKLSFPESLGCLFPSLQDLAFFSFHHSFKLIV